MEKILTQEEVDTLLGGISEGKIETEKGIAVDESAVKLHNLASHEGIIQGRMPSFEVINEHFTRLFKNSLSTALRKVADVSPVSSETIPFEQFIETLPNPVTLHIYKMNPLGGFALITMGGELVYACVSRLLGGDVTAQGTIPGRDFTAIEMRLIRRIVSLALEDIERSWQSVYPVKVEYVRSLVNPQSVGIVAGADMVLMTEFSVELEQTRGPMYVCIPYSVIVPIREKLKASFQSEQLEADPTWVKQLKMGLNQVPVELVVELGSVGLYGRDLLNLDVGDVIQLHTAISTPLIMKVQGVPKYLGFAGIFRGNKAFDIIGEIKDEKNGI